MGTCLVRFPTKSCLRLNSPYSNVVEFGVRRSTACFHPPRARFNVFDILFLDQTVWDTHICVLIFSERRLCSVEAGEVGGKV
jgi:hypothetical protein